VSLCFSALCAERPRNLGRRRGAGREPLRTVACGDLLAVVGEVAAPPALDPPTLRAYEAAVRGLAGAVDAILPVRFGTVFPDEVALRGVVAERREALTAALALVAGREQMTLRVFGDTAAAAPATAPRRVSATPRGGRAGTRYLGDRRAAAERARAVPEIDWLRPALSRFVRAERTERHARPPLLASVHHLIPRGRASAYLAAVDRALRTSRAVRVVASGPWPPWAFVSEEVA
jgi:hypothetical protein